MPVPTVLVASTSPSPAKVPPVIFTVASARLVASVTVRPMWKETRAGTDDKVGGSLTAVTLTVVVALAVGLLALPSLIVQTTLRLRSDPKSVGLRLVELNVT